MDALTKEYPIVAWVLLAAAVVAALHVLWRKAFRPTARAVWRAMCTVVRGWRKLDAFIDELTGTPATATAPARPGWSERLTGVEDTLQQQGKRLDAIDYQLHPNGGGSLRDQVDQIKDVVTSNEGV